MKHRTILSIVAMTVIFVPAGLARAQKSDDHKRAPDDPARRQGHLEVQRDPYITAPRGGQPRSPAPHISRGGYVSVQVNVDADGLNIVGDAANEPSIAVDPTNLFKMAIGWRQFDSILSDFRQAGWGYTADGGQTWTFPGVIEPGHFRSDPVLDADADGNFYYNSLTNEGGYICKVFKSTDGGATWDLGVYAHGGDKQWQAIDTTDGIGRGNIYASWNEFYSICDGHFTRSTDGGQSFEDCTTATGSPYWGTLAVGPDGELYLSGTGFLVDKSTTAQDPGQFMQWQLSTTVSLGGSIVFSAGPNPGGLLGQAWVAVDHSDDLTRGNAYLLCSVDPSGADPLDVMFARSTDGGQTFSAPIRVNDDASTDAWQWFGTMSVAPNGRIDAIWLDTRADPGGYDSELYYSYSTDTGVTWSANVALSPSFDPHIGWPQQSKMGDYFDMISDDQGANLAYAATFNGEQDVYFIRIIAESDGALQIAFPEGIPALVPSGEPTDITVQIVEGEETYVPDSATLYYRYDGGAYASLPLASLGGELYQATLPAPACGDTPEFYFSAEGSESGVLYEPSEAPVTTFTANVGVYVLITEDNFETDQGWTVESIDIIDGAWERGVPIADPGVGYYPPLSDYDGSGQCYLTENAFQADVDGGPTWLISPMVDLSATSNPVLEYARWWFNDDLDGDPLDVEISNDGGENWTLIERVAENDPDPDAVAVGEWVERLVFISDYVTLTSQVMVRFGAVDVPNNSKNEGGIDAVRVDDIYCGEVACSMRGDLTGDGTVDGADIQAFSDCHIGGDPGAPDCICADIDESGAFEPADVSEFVTCLLEAVCP